MDYGVVSQELIDHLKEMDKFFKENPIIFAPIGSKTKFEVKTLFGNCTFSCDMNRTGSFENKISLQLRYNRTNTILIRLDINGPEHTNPDGSWTDRDHVHVISESNGVIGEWGYSLQDFEAILIRDTANLYEVFTSFCSYNKIVIHGKNIQYSV